MTLKNEREEVDVPEIHQQEKKKKKDNLASASLEFGFCRRGKYFAKPTPHANSKLRMKLLRWEVSVMQDADPHPSIREKEEEKKRW